MTCEDPLSANLSQDPAPGVVPSTSNPGNGSGSDAGQAPAPDPQPRRRTKRGNRGGKGARRARTPQPAIPADEGRRTAPTLAEAQAQLAAVKAALTEQYRAHHRETPRQDPQPPEWLTEDYWRQALATDTPSPKARSTPNTDT